MIPGDGGNVRDENENGIVGGGRWGGLDHDDDQLE